MTPQYASSDAPSGFRGRRPPGQWALLLAAWGIGLVSWAFWVGFIVMAIARLAA